MQAQSTASRTSPEISTRLMPSYGRTIGWHHFPVVSRSSLTEPDNSVQGHAVGARTGLQVNSKSYGCDPCVTRHPTRRGRRWYARTTCCGTAPSPLCHLPAHEGRAGGPGGPRYGGARLGDPSISRGCARSADLGGYFASATVAMNSRHSSGTPLRTKVPLSFVAIPEAMSWPLTVSETSTCPGSARSQMRFAIVTVRPMTSSARFSTSPLWTPAVLDSHAVR